MPKNHHSLLIPILAALCQLSACEAPTKPENAQATPELKLATTTSTDNSGLLEVLLPAFKKETGIDVKVIAVGTGKALKHGEAGDVDAILVHARKAEDRFVAEGYGVNRRGVMHNDFVILGPPRDPAGIKGIKDASAALARISSTMSPFVSRGDESGTHKREMELWKSAGISPDGRWYMPIGQGMGAVLIMTEEKEGYALADRGTYLAYKGKLRLDVLVAGDPRLFNPYGIIAVNPARHSHVNHREAMAFLDWLTSPAAQKLIADFTVDGERLFEPDAVPLR